jgi:hypothetical protein
MTKYIIGMVGSFGTLLAGAWLMLAPFALGYQPSGAAWVNATVTDFWTGVILLVISLVGLLLYGLGLTAELRRLGNQANMEQVLQTLAAALLKDMQEQRREDGAPVLANSRVYNQPAETERRNEL